MLEELIQWLKDNMPELADAEFHTGPWADSTANATKRLVSVMGNGGRGTLEETDYAGLRVLILSQKDGNKLAGEKIAIYRLAELVRARIKENYRTCNTAQIRLIGGIIGPGVTEGNRLWSQLQFETISF